jgi:hypothetical protein
MRRGILTLLLVPLLAGCGARTASNPGSGPALKTSNGGSSRIELQMMVGKEPAWTIAGVYDYVHGVGRFNDVEGYEVLYTGDAIYTAVPRFAPTKGKRWLKLPASEDGLLSPFARNPAALLGFLRGASDVETIASDQVRGVNVTHDRARLNFERAAGEMPAKDRTDIRGIFREYWPDQKSASIDFWVDSEDRLRRVQVELPENDGTATQMTVDFFDYGIPVDVKAPPADETLTEEEFGKLMLEDCKKEKLSTGSASEGYDVCGHMFTFGDGLTAGSR